MKSVKYLEDVKNKFGLKTNVALAKKLGLSEAAVSHYMKQNRVMEEETCLTVALLLDINPVEILMAAGMDRAEKTGQKSLWSVFSERMAATAASALLLTSVTLFLTPGDANANALPYEKAPAPKMTNLYYVKSRRRKSGLLRAVFAWGKRVAMPGALQPATP